MKKQFLILFAFISVLALSQVPQRFNKVIVTGDIASPKFIKTGSNADSVLLGNGSARSVNSLKTDTVSLSNRINAKATGSGTANGTNTGDETITSIKTKLGAATAVSDGYLKYQDWNTFNNKVSNATHTGDATGSTALTLATVNSNVGTFNNVTINAKGLATAGSNVSYEPSFSKNTGFNKNFGTTTGTVLEGRTFGTAAGSAVGDFIQNQNSSAQSANMWISGSSKSGVVTSYGNINVNSANDANLYITNTSTNGKSWQFTSEADGRLTVNNAGVLTALQLATSGAATFSSTVNSTQLQSTVATGTAPLTVNSTTMVANLNAQYLGGTSRDDYFLTDRGNVTSININGLTASGGYGIYNGSTSLNHPFDGAYGSILNIGTYYGTQLYFNYDGTRALFRSTNTVTSDWKELYHSGNLTGNLTTNYLPKWNGSNFVNATAGTDYQLPITLTTNGTSGAATFSGNVLNVPNYTSSGACVNISPSSVQSGSIWIDGILNSSTVSAPSINTSYINFNSIPNGQQTSGSVSGNVIFNMPFNGAFYKKVIITLLNLQGSASWTFTSAFSNLPVVLNTDGLPSSIVTSKSLTSITLNCATPTSGILILEGY